MEPRRFCPVPRMRPMHSSLGFLRRRAPFIVSLAFLAACQDAPVAPNLRPRAASADVSAAGTFVVVNTANDGAGSLRQALSDAEAAPGADVVTFAIPETDPGCTGGTCTITLTSALFIRWGEVTVDGTGSRIVVSGNDVAEVLVISTNRAFPAAVSLKFLTLQDGRTTRTLTVSGGCIANYAGILRLDHVTVRSCFAEETGGGIYSEGQLELESSIVADNYAAYGGGIAADALTMNKSSVERNTSEGGAALTIGRNATMIADSRIVDNSTNEFEITQVAGGVAVGELAVVTMVRTLVSGNSISMSIFVQGARAGGIWNSGNLTMINSTISGNVANDGPGMFGGLYNSGTLRLSHVTVAGNVGPVTAIGSDAVAGAVRLSHSIVDGGAGPACAGAMTDDGYNIDRGTTCGFGAATSRSNTDALLGSLADNGGQSFTHKLLTGSPALNAIPVGTNGCGTAGETDQRGTGFARFVGFGCDIGAYEHQVPLPVFGGFLSPVKAGIVNQLNAGRVLPVNFKLGGDFGLTPFVTGYPMVTVTSCPASSVARYNIPSSSTTTGVKASKLNYNALTGQYTYLWVTEKNWEGSCRRLTFRFTGENVAYSLDVEFVR